MLFDPPPPDDGLRSRARQRVALGILALLAVMAGLGWSMRAVYQEREQRYRHVVESNLLGMSALQARGVQAWRQRRLDEAAMLSGDALLVGAVARWRAAPDPRGQQVLVGRLRALVEHMQYAQAFLVDPDGRLLLDDRGPAAGTLPAPEREALRASLALAQPAPLGLQRNAALAFPHFGLIAPLLDGSQAVGAVWLVVDARATLYPVLQGWPDTSGSAESLLLERHGDELVYLSPLRHRDAEPLSLRVPVRQSADTTAALAVAGLRGVMYGRDYRGRDVLATARAVPGSGWVLVSKVDAAEVFTDARRREWLAAALFALLALLPPGAVLLGWQWRAWRRERVLNQRLENNMRWLESAQRAASMGYFAYDIERQVFSLSSMAWAIFGRSGNPSMTLKQWSALLDPQERESVLRLHTEAMVHQTALHARYRIVLSGEEHPRWIEVRADYSQEPGGANARITGTVQDITERHHIEQQLERYRAALEAQVRIDPLTQLSNRLALNERVALEWERALRAQAPLALLMIDVDRFKAFNDRYGHMAGDRCLQGVSRALMTTMGRAGDMVARYGGEEFAVLLPGADGAQALAVAERLREAVRALAIVHADGSADGIVTISAGAASVCPGAGGTPPGVPRPGMDAAHALFRQADAALYRAKQLGRDRAVLYSAQCDGALHDAPDLWE